MRKIRRGEFVRDPDLDGPIGELIDVVNHHGKPMWQTRRGAIVEALLYREELAKSWWFYYRRTRQGGDQ